MLRNTRTVSPGWFRSHILPPFQPDWATAEAGVQADPLERRRIDELAADMARNGFQRPVVVGRDRWFSHRPRVWDGMHRAIAAMRIGVAIPVVRGYRADSEWSEDDYTVTAVGTDIDTLMDAVLSLSSFRCSVGPWIQCDVASAAGDGPVRLLLTRHPELRLRIVAELTDRLRSAGIDADVAFVEESD